MQAAIKARVEKKEGSKSSISHRTFQINVANQLVPSELIGDKSNQQALISGWARLVTRLAVVSDEIATQQQQTIPETSYDELVSSPSPELIRRIRQCGSVVIHGTVPQNQVAMSFLILPKALKWLEETKEYIKLNPRVKGFPEDDKQVYEVYWSKPQQEARSHPQMIKTQAALLGIFTAPPQCQVSLTTPLVYADRLRIRTPGDATFALGPHMDGGSIERWEDLSYRKVYEKILQGRWEEFDAWDIENRTNAIQDLYPGPGSTGVFRSWQGWTSLSETGPNEGTLLVYPFIKEHTAYLLMRPLFKPKHERSEFKDDKDFLAPDNWELDFESTNFPGSPPYRNQELNDETHPHLELLRTMVRMPKVYPGDSVWWHSDVIHAVESKHQGKIPASVFYIPAVALTARNAEYIRDQRATFHSGRPAPDFPGGTGESDFVSRGTGDDLLTVEGREGMGLVPFQLTDGLSEGELQVRKAANAILGF
ncbi:unnamed protein product [Clonostachys rosea]|uniref:DUF1479 domain protein n=1 Tax=Bionectria ochroleuca TaxID=29856 RepID=A0ABY6UYL0_BIOOC|nr:unnamed protein product [Clonostachys rosea]